MSSAIGQIICECGNVAEIRRRRNGRKLPFKSCKSCGVQQGKEPLREKWLEEMRPVGFYGIYGKPPRIDDLKPEPDPQSAPEVATETPPQVEVIPPEPKQDSPVGKIVLGLAFLVAMAAGATR